MNTTLKHWREAATLILAAGHRLGPGTLPSRTPLSSSDGRSHLPHRSCFDYDVLLLKRSSKSGFMPSAYVFPGGMVDPSDFSNEWLDIFKSFTGSPNFGVRRVTQVPESRPPIFATDRLKLGSALPGEVAFRICALRETFEESGVLLVVSKLEEKQVLESIDGGCDSKQVKLAHSNASALSSSELKKWRALVNENPSNFIKMCRELEVIPNIWALHEWCNWLTPLGRFKTRYDTVFFICCLQEIPETLQDEKEIVHFKWTTPSQVLQSYQNQEFWIAPPQFYELSRMCRLPLLNDLHNFSRQRATVGCEQWLPILTSKDGLSLSLLPGDCCYPSDTSDEDKLKKFMQAELEEPGDDTALHRIVNSDLYTTYLQITITPKYSHLLPFLGQAVPHESKSHL